jgi:hypothetical protein
MQKQPRSLLPECLSMRLSIELVYFNVFCGDLMVFTDPRVEILA